MVTLVYGEGLTISLETWAVLFLGCPHWGVVLSEPQGSVSDLKDAEIRLRLKSSRGLCLLMASLFLGLPSLCRTELMPMPSWYTKNLKSEGGLTVRLEVCSQ